MEDPLEQQPARPADNIRMVTATILASHELAQYFVKNMITKSTAGLRARSNKLTPVTQ
ncbi:hypothetical protein [Noviherbaspirillum denitrificans]|uniref:hypothetical protein n=1 Tax=Noviherbaspirillum denitrificans TaxID=1968433 RepID=UPI0014836A90|nr:hypothetical protein [Noviherbaspirillum denitrificans]